MKLNKDKINYLCLVYFFLVSLLSYSQICFSWTFLHVMNSLSSFLMAIYFLLPLVESTTTFQSIFAGLTELVHKYGHCQFPF